jgi:predicted nucleic acid-binding protein
MRTVFGDSFYFLAAINEHDEAHDRVRLFAQSELYRLITTEWVIMEVGDAFAKPHWRPAFLRMVHDLRRDENVRIIEVSHELFDRALNLFAARPDTEWSLTDCTSFVVMEDQRIAEALTGDRHFQQAGFVALLE